MLPVILPKVDGISTQPADEMNGVFYELENLVEKTGQTMSGASTDQLGIAVSTYAAGGDYYIGAGSANAQTLSVVGSKLAPIAYFDGMRARFIPAASNTAATTVNVAGIGAVALNANTSGTAIPAGTLVAGTEVEIYYHAAGPYFVVSSLTGGQIQNNSFNYAADTGVVNVLTVALTPPLTSYIAGQVVYVKPNHTNTISGATLNVNGLGAVAIVRPNLSALQVGDIVIGSDHSFVFDGVSAFVLQNPATNISAVTAAATYTPFADFVATLTSAGSITLPTSAGPAGAKLILKWGIGVGATSSSQTITFPTPFPTACLHAQVTTGYNATNVGDRVNGLDDASLSAAGFDILTVQFPTPNGDSITPYWFAIGY